MDMKSAEPPSWIELESVINAEKTEKITDLSWDTYKRRYPHLVINLSPRRQGTKPGALSRSLMARLRRPDQYQIH